MKTSNTNSDSFWSNALPYIPVITLIVGFFLNSGYEQYKRLQSISMDKKLAEKLFIGKQLDEFYYPLKQHLQKDDAIWTVWNNNNGSYRNQKLADYIEQKVLFPNHDTILHILERNYHLIKNVNERVVLTNLYKEINHYQRHVAVYKALRTTDDKRNTVDIPKCQCDYPKGFEIEIDKRIKSLETQRAAVIR